MALVLLSFVALLCQLIAMTSPSVIYKTESIDCRFNPTYLADGRCALKAINRHKTFLNVDARIVGMLRNLSLHLQLFRKNDVNKYLPFLVNVTINVCDAMAKRTSSVYGAILIRVIKTKSNVNHTCPYSGRIMGRNISLDEQHMRFVPLPFGLYKFEFKTSEGHPGEEIVGMTVQVNVFEEKRKLPFNIK